jgi:hypothetical protein
MNFTIRMKPHTKNILYESNHRKLKDKYVSLVLISIRVTNLWRVSLGRGRRGIPVGYSYIS